MTENVKTLIAEAGEIAQYADEQGHNGASRVIRKLVSALEAATATPAVDREALAKFFDHQGLAGPNVMASELIESGILRDVRDVQAEALEQAAEGVRGVGGLGSETSGHTSTYSVRNWLRVRAQAIREARNER